MAQFKGVRKLSVKQYNKLKSNGLLDKNILYVTPEKGLSVLQGETAPTTETEGVVGQFYLDITAKKLYQCVNVIVDETAGTTTYEWQAVGSGVSQEDFDNLVNNTTKIKGISDGFSAGKNSFASTGGAVGNGAKSSDGGAIGTQAKTGDGFAGGYNAQTKNNGTFIDAVQLGTGTNPNLKTMQVYNDNIYDSNTHTLTVQNIEQNGNNVLGVITGFEGTPTHNTVGEVGQIIITQSWDAYICVAYDDVEYTWKKITI